MGDGCRPVENSRVTSRVFHRSRPVPFMSLVVALGLVTGATAPKLTITYKARAVQPGELVVLTIVSNTAVSTIDVKAFNRSQRAQALPPTSARPHAWIALVGIDLDVRPGTYTVSVSATGP